MNHIEEAKRYVENAEAYEIGSSDETYCLKAAQIHAAIAIAEQLKRLADDLCEVPPQTIRGV